MNAQDEFDETTLFAAQLKSELMAAVDCGSCAK